MDVCFWYLVKPDLSSVRYLTVAHNAWMAASLLTRYKKNTTCLSGRVVPVYFYIVEEFVEVLDVHLLLLQLLTQLQYTTLNVNNNVSNNVNNNVNNNVHNNVRTR